MSTLSFDKLVPSNGYAWWYLDAISDDGEHALTVIAFVGSVFSPYYAWARRRQGVMGANPNEHCAINVGLYDLTPDKRHGNYWTMTERGAASVRRDAHQYRAGPSDLQWQDGELIVTLNERTAPVPRPVKGTIRLTPTVDVAAANHRVAIDGNIGQHFWQPIAPTARVQVAFSQPNMCWTGQAYLDSNFGATPLESTFREWQWTRASLADGSTAVRYDVSLLDGSRVQLARQYATNGKMSLLDPAPALPFAGTRWGIARACHNTAAVAPTVAATLESGPFYARSLVNTAWHGEPVVAVHESLSLTRFANPLVQAMLPFRMPRRA
jgi:carotenoid 1,2-hydratase